MLDREKPLSWSTEQREVESLRTSMDKFDRMDYDSHTKVRLNALYMCSNKSLWPRRLSVVYVCDCTRGGDRCQLFAEPIF